MARLWVQLLLSAALCAQGRVLVLGVDGFDHALVQRFMAEGKLPELAALAQGGTGRKLATTNPAQSPVAWASMTTGLLPGKTRILGFLERGIEQGAVVPRLAGVKAVPTTVLSTPARILWIVGSAVPGLLLWLLLRRRWPRAALFTGLLVLAVLVLVTRVVLAEIPHEIVKPVNDRQGHALWDLADAAGVAATSLRAPMAFPAPKLEHGRLLTGLGTPDIVGTPGSWAIHSIDPVPEGRELTRMGGRLVALKPASDGSWQGSVAGPKDPLERSGNLSVAMTLEGAEAKRLSVGAHSVPLGQQFTEFVEVHYPLGRILPPLRGLTRFRPLDPDARRIYQEPVGFDPRHQMPMAPVTSPSSMGSDLCAHGLFETCGWATATNPFQDERISGSVFMEDVRSVLATDERLLLEEAHRGDWRVLFAVIAAPDRVQHVTWSAFDTTHPAHETADPTLAAAIPWVYGEVDRIVGRLRREILRAEDTLLLVSDHGFASFEYAVNLNRWLVDGGYLAAAKGSRSLGADLGQPVRSVDWARTKAYHLGLGRIWLNLVGREPEGLVLAKDADALLAEIRTGLLALRHEGRPVIRSVELAKDLYGDGAAYGCDLVIGFERGFRTSWDACLLGCDEPVVAKNSTRWTGDHCSVDPELVPGVIFSSRPLGEREARIVDVLPTILDALGIARGAELDGQSLWRRNP
jgi:predicted AlkP superfamily phosphohydrolase/phosphomutase